MLKKIEITDVQLGMYIHEICGEWIDNPFWLKSFKLVKQKDLDALCASGLKEVWIDTDKGLDIEKSTVDLAQAPIPETDIQVTSKKGKVTPVSIQEELVAAKKIHAKAKEAVISMFSEVRMGNALETEGAELLVNEISQSMMRNSNALLSLARLKNADEYTYLHSVAVCILMVALGKQLGIKGDQLKQVGVAGLLHDIGKMAIPNEVLNKPGSLTDQEFSIVKEHPRKGWEMLKTSYDVSDLALDVCLHHHERVDGQGYPEKLSGEALSLYARMGAVCDVYDAITSDRCYKKGWEPAEAIRRMVSWKNGHFDETILHAFVKTIGIYPNGTLLRLKSGHLGVVTEQSSRNLTMPRVKIFFSIRANAHIPIEVIDVAKSADAIVSVEDPQQWKLDLSKVRDV